MNSNSNQEELVNEMVATRRAIAIYLKRLLAVEEKIDRFTTEKEQHWKDEQVKTTRAELVRKMTDLGIGDDQRTR